jgi:hypothetical protein
MKMALYYIPYVGKTYFEDYRPRAAEKPEGQAQKYNQLKRATFRSQANGYSSVTLKLTTMEWIYSLLGWSRGSISAPKGMKIGSYDLVPTDGSGNILSEQTEETED